MVRPNTTGSLPRVELDERVTEFLKGFMAHYGVSSYKEALVLLTRKYTELESQNHKLQRLTDGITINIQGNSAMNDSSNQPVNLPKQTSGASKADKAFMNLLK